MKSINIRFPLKDDLEKNSFLNTSKISKDALSSNLLLLLLTQKGERYYQPNYGTNLLKYVFDPDGTMTYEGIEEEIKQTVSLYMPIIKIKNIQFNRFGDDEDVESENELNVKIRFTYSEDVFSEEGEIDLNF